jgi:tetraacyldisaccharide 4'-kinase
MRAPAFWTIRYGRDAVPMLRLLLTPLGWLYGASVQRRMRLTRPAKLPIPVVSIGNLTAGGTGKTPVTLMIEKLLRPKFDMPVAILTRGYGGSVEGPELVDTRAHTAAQVGDEPFFMAGKALIVVVARDRAAGGRYILDRKWSGILMDDAHQNPSLHKDLSIVIVDGETGFGNGCLIPAGPLREHVALGLARADVVITMGPVSEETREDLAGYEGPIIAANLVPEPTRITGKVVGFCGIGRPEKFDATLRELGLDVVDMFPFPDHHPYTSGEVERLIKVASDVGATLVTTQKDFVRLPSALADKVRVIAVTAVVDDQAKLLELLGLAIDRARART